MEYRFSLTPRLVAVGLFSMVALFVLLFLLGMQVGLRTAKPEPGAAAAVAADPVGGAQKKLAEGESALKQVAAPAAPAPAAAAPAVATPAPAVKH